MRCHVLARRVCQALLLSTCQALLLAGARPRLPVPTMSILERPDSPLFCLNVCLRVKPERREEFLACIRANQKGTLATEPLAVTYAYGEDESTPDTWRFFEQYEGKAGFEAHTKTEHFAAWEAFASSEPSPFSAPPEVRFFVEDSATSVCAGAAAVREVVEDGDFTKLFCLDVTTNPNSHPNPHPHPHPHPHPNPHPHPHPHPNPHPSPDQVTMSVKPESREAFLEALRADQQGALADEPQAVSYLFGEDTETPNVFHMFEAYSGGRTLTLTLHPHP